MPVVSGGVQHGGDDHGVSQHFVNHAVGKSFGITPADVLARMAAAVGVNVLLCLLGATAAFGMALAVYFWKR